jgi:hypothetical protein
MKLLASNNKSDPGDWWMILRVLGGGFLEMMMVPSFKGPF